MKKIALLAMMFATPAAAFTLEVPDAWLQCKTKTECNAVKGICYGSWVAVNRSHVNDLEQKIAERMTIVSCARPVELAPAQLDCMNGLCVVTND